MIRKRKLNRLKEYDYSQDGCYFATICVRDKKEWFGKIETGRMVLNEYGEIIEQRWLWLRRQYPYVKLDEFVVMPNHFHGILVIDSNHIIIGNGRDRSLQKIKPLSELIGAFKTTSSKLIHQSGLNVFRWQKSFYDHIIRNEKTLQKIREYIQNNPLKWDLDEYNPYAPKGLLQERWQPFINR